MKCARDNCCREGYQIRKTDNKVYCHDCASNIIGFYSEKIPKNKKQYVGVELEIMPNTLDELSPKWCDKSDGSLSYGGREYVFQKPLTVKIAKKEISKAGTIFKRNKSYIDNKCGYHLHLDCSYLNYDQVLSFLRFCLSVEESVFSLVSNSRRNNIFTKYLPKFSDSLLPEVRNLTALQLLMWYKNNVTNNKFNWCNLKSFFLRNTIEIRVHHGTVDKIEINNWIELWTKLLKYVANGNLPDIDNNDILYWAKLAGVSDDIIVFYESQRSKFSVR